MSLESFEGDQVLLERSNILGSSQMSIVNIKNNVTEAGESNLNNFCR